MTTTTATPSVFMTSRLMDNVLALLAATPNNRR